MTYTITGRFHSTQALQNFPLTASASVLLLTCMLTAFPAYPQTTGIPYGSVILNNPPLSSEYNLLHGYVGDPGGAQRNPTFETLPGSLEWYYSSNLGGGTVLYRPTGNGTYLGDDSSGQRVIEFDSSGNLIWSVTVAQMNAQLPAADQITVVNHDAFRLPDGSTALIASNNRVLSFPHYANIAYLGDVIIVVDASDNIKWHWNAFDYLDVNRSPTLHDHAYASSKWPYAPLPPGYAWGVDWLHFNTVSRDPKDENLVISVRDQDWVIKIDYQDGAGDGHVIWRLGQGGDFTLNDPNNLGGSWPWFSHQHDAQFASDGTLTLFDNGNTRVASLGPENSRGMVLALDEVAMTATLLQAIPLPYSPVYGSAQLLANGDFHFESGFQKQSDGSVISQDFEYSPAVGAVIYIFQSAAEQYRSFRQ